MTDLRRWAALVLAIGLGAGVLADDLLDDLKPAAKPKSPAGAVDDLLDRADGRIRFRLVRHDQPDEGLDQDCYWRTVEGIVAARVAPTEFRLGDEETLAPQAAAGKAEGAEPTYLTESLVKLPSGKHLLSPGGIPIEVRAGEATSKHPAVRVAADRQPAELRIPCAPVRLEAVDAWGVAGGRADPGPARTEVALTQGRPVQSAGFVAAGGRTVRFELRPLRPDGRRTCRREELAIGAGCRDHCPRFAAHGRRGTGRRLGL